MTREEVLSAVQDIFRDIFDAQNLLVTDETDSDDIEDWDSMNHINLVSAVEKKFNIRFALGELQTLNNVGAMIDLMMQKLS
jgi:acyl carrier protein